MTHATKPVLLGAQPELFVTDMQATCDYFTAKLGFKIVFLYGEPPFYGQVGRDNAALNLRHVDAPLIDGTLRDRENFLSASIAVDDVAALYWEVRAAGANFHQMLRTEPWGATTFIVKDPDGNLILFA